MHWWNPLRSSCFLPIQVSKTELSPEALISLRTATGYQGNTLSRIRISAFKPNFEVGSSNPIKLSFAKKTPKPGRLKNPVLSFSPCLIDSFLHLSRYWANSQIISIFLIIGINIFYLFSVTKFIKCMWGSKMYNVCLYKVTRNENTTFNLWFLAEKLALDPETVQKWTLSANDMNDDDVVSNVFTRRVTPHTL